MTEQNKIESLLEQFEENRTALKAMIADLESLQKKINELFPESLDKRYRYFFEQKVKAASEFFKVLLDMRKELSRSLKDEIDLRRKMEVGQEEEIEKLLDIRSIASKIEKLDLDQSRRKKDVLEQKVKQSLKSVKEVT